MTGISEQAQAEAARLVRQYVHGTDTPLKNEAFLKIALAIEQRNNATRELEMIAAFDNGAAGDVACRFLIEAGVWTAHMRRMDGKPLALPPHTPHRESDVAAWIKRHRDQFFGENIQGSERWHALDRLLDDYRLHADTGTPLDQEALDGGDPESQGAHL